MLFGQVTKETAEVMPLPIMLLFFFQAEDGIRDLIVTGVQTCALFFSSRRRHTRSDRDWSSDVCSSDLERAATLYNEVIAAASDFAPAYFGRLLVVAQTNPTERTLREEIGRASCRERV